MAPTLVSQLPKHLFLSSCARNLIPHLLSTSHLLHRTYSTPNISPTPPLSKPLAKSSSPKPKQENLSLSRPSLGILLTELAPTTPEMVAQGLRKEGETMDEGQRTFARRTVFWVMGVPVAVGAVIVGWEVGKGFWEGKGWGGGF